MKRGLGSYENLKKDDNNDIAVSKLDGFQSCGETQMNDDLVDKKRPFHGQTQSPQKEQARELENAFKPLFLIIKIFVDQLFKSMGYDSNLIKKNDDAAAVVNDYSHQIESYCYQLMHFTLEYIFTNDLDIQMPSNYRRNDIQNQTLLFVQKIKQHFAYKPRNSLQLLLNKLQTLNNGKISGQLGYLVDNSDDEGIFGADDDRDSENLSESMINGFQVKNQYFEANDEASVKEMPVGKFKQLEERVQDLQFKLKLREETIVGLTTGYLKDIQHWQEMIFRKDNIDDVELYEVQYFDVSNSVDIQTRDMLNEKLKDLKNQYETKSKDFMKKIFALTTEIDRIKKAHAAAANANSDGAPSGLNQIVQQLLMLEDSPYQIWKTFQDLKGNQFFFNVFENQRPEYGINYREVNQLLQCQKFYEKEYNGYKKTLEDQMCGLIQRTTVELDQIKSELKEKDQMIDQLNETIQETKMEKAEEILDLLPELIQEKQNVFQAKYQEMRKQTQKELQEIQIIKLRNVIMRWSCIARAMKATQGPAENFKEEMQNILLKNSFTNEIQQVYLQQLRNLEAEKRELEQKINIAAFKEHQFKSIIQERDNSIVGLQSDLMGLKNTVSSLGKDQRKAETKVFLYESNIQSIFEKLGTQIKDEQFEDLDIEDEKKLTTKVFLQSIKKVEKPVLRNLRETKIMMEKNDSTHNALFVSDPIREQQTLTDTYDLSQPIYTENQLILRLQEEEQKYNALLQAAEEEREQNRQREKSVTKSKASISVDKDTEKSFRKQSERAQSQETEKKDEILDPSSQGTSIKIPQVDTEQVGIQTNLTSDGIEKIQKRVSDLTKDIQRLESDISDQSNQHVQAITQLQNEIKLLQQQQTQQQQQFQQQLQSNHHNTNNHTQLPLIPQNNQNTGNVEDEASKIRRSSGINQALLKSNTNHTHNSDEPEGEGNQPFNLQKSEKSIPGSPMHQNNDTITIDREVQSLMEQDESGLIGSSRKRSGYVNTGNQDYIVDDSEEQDDDVANGQGETKQGQGMRPLSTEKTVKREVSNGAQQKRKKKVFDRLFDEYREKAGRLQHLQRDLEQLETFHWEQVLSILHLYSRNIGENGVVVPELQNPYKPDKHIDMQKGERIHNMSANYNNNNNIYNYNNNIVNNITVNNSTNNNKELKEIQKASISHQNSANVYQQQNSQQYGTGNNFSNNINSDRSKSPITFHENPLQKYGGPAQITSAIQSPLFQTRAEFFFQKSKENNTAAQKSSAEDRGEFTNIFQELNQQNYERRKTYLESVIDTFQQHTLRMQGNFYRQEPDLANEMKITQNQKLNADLSHTPRKLVPIHNQKQNSLNNRQNQDESNEETGGVLPNDSMHQWKSPLDYENALEESLQQNIDNLNQQNISSQKNNQSRITHSVNVTPPNEQNLLQQNKTNSGYTTKQRFHLLQGKHDFILPQCQTNKILNSTSGNNNNNSVFLPDSIMSLVQRGKPGSREYNNINSANQSYDIGY